MEYNALLVSSIHDLLVNFIITIYCYTTTDCIGIARLCTYEIDTIDFKIDILLGFIKKRWSGRPVS